MSLRRWVVRSFLQRSKICSYTPLVQTREYKYKHEKNQTNYYKVGIGALLGSVLIGTSNIPEKSSKKESLETKNVPLEAGVKRPDLPTYTAAEVSKHDSKASFWVTYKHGVYDVTEFLTSHPGGEQIYNAAGLSIEPFWNVYGMHKTQEVFKLLESYRIGNLHDEDVADYSDEELWAREPRRDARLVVHTARPFNAEIPAQEQVAHFDTPNELFYVRQHMPVPEIDPATHKLRVTIIGKTVTQKEFSLEELGQFKKRTVRAALMCAGNRRSEMAKEVKEKTVKGISWAGGAISNAVWSGVYLRDVLVHCGVDERDTRGKHVILQGADVDATGVKFSTSIPLRAALDGARRVLLASHMNGAALAPDHGRPLRALVPGAPAVRSVKWLGSELKTMLNDLNAASLEVGLRMNKSKTKLMTDSTQHRVTIGGGENMEYVHEYLYLGQLVSFQSRQDLEITGRTENAWKGSWAMKHLIKESITVSDQESSSHWHLKDYRSFNPSETWETADFSTAPAVYSLPVTSAICDPADGDAVSVAQGYIEARGYAYSGGGAAVLRVDVSADAGATWTSAQLQQDSAPHSTHYAWTLWTVRIPVSKDQGEVELWAKATDSNFNTQPEKFDHIWNIRGILSNAYHKIKVTLVH